MNVPVQPASSQPVRTRQRSSFAGWLGLVAFFFFATIFLNPGVLDFFAVSHYGPWFADTYAILAANDALARGLDVHASNPLDYFGRPHVYSNWWLGLGKLGLTRADTFAIGLVIVGAFFVAVLGRLRPQTPREVVWYLAVWCTPPVLLALERANNDLVVFSILAALVPCLLTRHRAGRYGAVLLIALAAGLKFYPAVAALVLLGGEDDREIRLSMLMMVLALGVVGLTVRDDLAGFGTIAPQPQGLLSFGASTVARLVGWSGVESGFVSAALGVVIMAAWARSGVFEGWKILPAERNVWLSFVLGALLLTACFFASGNYAYRFVFAIWLAPLLWRLPRNTGAPRAVRRLAKFTGILLIAVLWMTPVLYAVLKYLNHRLPAGEAPRWANRLLLAEQPVFWMFFACLLGFLTHFILEGGRRLVVGRNYLSSTP